MFALCLSLSLFRIVRCLTGVGTRHYYRKLGYELEGPYMVKTLVYERDEADDYEY